MPEGNFGSLRFGGKDHAAGRYIETYLNPIVKKIFREEDECVLNHLVEEGMKVEYESFYPIIPMVLINGSKGVGTGYSSEIPNFNIRDVIYNLKCIIENPNEKGINNMRELTPYYNCIGHTNFIHPNDIFKVNNTKWISFASYDIINNKGQNKIHIKALPVGVWTKKYIDPQKGILSKLKDDDIILNYDNRSGTDDVNIDVVVNNLSQYLKNVDEFGYTDLNKTFGFTKNITTTNMYLHEFKDGKNILSKYGSANDIIVDFYNMRRKKYIERKKIMLLILKYNMEYIKYQIKFIDEILNDTIIWHKKDDEEVIKQLEIKKYPMMGSSYNDENKSYKYLLNIPFHNFTKNKRNELENERKKKEELYDEYNKTTIKDLWLKEIKEIEDYLDKIDNQNKIKK